MRLYRGWCWVLVLALGWSNLVGAAPDEAESGLAERRARVLRLSAPHRLTGWGLKSAPYELLAVTAAVGCRDGAWADFMARFASPQTNPDPNSPIEIFGLPPLVRYLYQYGECLSQDQKATLLSGLTRPQALFAHGTLNHAAMQATSWYLLAQYFPSARWTNDDGRRLSSPQLMALLKASLLARHQAVYARGHLEMLSPSYAIDNIFPMLNLADFATDPVMQAVGDREALLEVAALRVHAFHGVIMPPLTRKNFDQRNAREQPENYVPSVSQQVLWFYFGEPQALSDYDLRSTKEPFYVIMLALSKWRPPAVLADWAPVMDKGYRLQVVTPANEIWGVPQFPGFYMQGDAYISDQYALGLGNVRFNPSGYEDHVQAFGLSYKSKDALNQISCYQPYFNSNLGEDAWASDRWSPFQQAHLIDEHSAVILFDIPRQDPWRQLPLNRQIAKRDQHLQSLLQVFQCRVPTDADEIVVDGPAVYVREGAVWMALVGLQGPPQVSSGWLAPYRFIKWRQSRGAVYVHVEVATSPMDLKAFKARVAAEQPSYQDAARAVRLPDATARRVGVSRVVFDPMTQADGTGRYDALPELLDLAGKPVQRSQVPWQSGPMTLNQGVLTLRGHGATLEQRAASGTAAARP